MLSTVINKASFISLGFAENEKQLVKPCELDIYFEPEPEIKYVEESKPASLLYENVSSTRRCITNAFSGLLTTHEKVSNLYTFMENNIADFYHNTTADPYFLLQPVTITFAAFGGALITGKGKRPIRRTLYTTLFGATAAATWHPQRALDIATTGYYHTASSLGNISNLWKRETVTEKVQQDIDASENVKDDSQVDNSKIGEVDSHKPEVTGNVLADEASSSTEETVDLVEKAEATLECDVKSDDVESFVIIDQKDVVENVTEATKNDASIETKISESALPATEDNNQEELIVETRIIEIDTLQTDEVTPKVLDSLEAKQAEDNKNDLTETQTFDSTQEGNTTELINAKDKSHHIEFESKSNEVTMAGDCGQSDPEDMDMYSTRS